MNVQELQDKMQNLIETMVTQKKFEMAVGAVLVTSLLNNSEEFKAGVITTLLRLQAANAAHQQMGAKALLNAAEIDIEQLQAQVKNGQTH